MFCAFVLPNDELRFFFATSVGNGRYSSLFFDFYWDSIGTIDVIFIVSTTSRHLGGYATTQFSFIPRPPELPSPPEPPTSVDLLISMAVTISVTFGVIGLYFYRRYSPTQRMKIPELKLDLMNEANNLINVLNINFKQLLMILEDPKTETFNKILEAYDLIDEMNRQLRQLRKFARDIGGR